MSPSVAVPAVGALQRGQRAHQRRLAGAVRPEQAEHAGRNGQRHAVERLDAVGVALGQVTNDELHSNLGGARIAGGETSEREDAS